MPADDLAECPCSDSVHRRGAFRGDADYREEIVWALRARAWTGAPYNVCRLCGGRWSYQFGSVPVRRAPTELVAVFRLAGGNAVHTMLKQHPEYVKKNRVKK